MNYNEFQINNPNYMMWARLSFQTFKLLIIETSFGYWTLGTGHWTQNNWIHRTTKLRLDLDTLDSNKLDSDYTWMPWTQILLDIGLLFYLDYTGLGHWTWTSTLDSGFHSMEHWTLDLGLTYILTSGSPLVPLIVWDRQ